MRGLTRGTLERTRSRLVPRGCAFTDRMIGSQCERAYVLRVETRGHPSYLVIKPEDWGGVLEPLPLVSGRS